MPATTASAATGQWANLPANLLCDIAHRLRAASDSVRFDAVCRPWRDARKVQEGLLLPWLLAPSEAGDGSAEDQRCRCVFSRTSYRAPGVCVRDMRVACGDGTAAWLLSAQTKLSLVNPLTADPLPFPRDRLDRKWVEHRHRIISDDGAVLLYDFTPDRPRDGFPYGRGRFCASFLRPGDSKWRRVWSNLSGTDRCCAAAYFYGYIVCVGLADCHILWPDWVTFAEGLYRYETTGQLEAALPEEPGKVRRCSYLLEDDGRLLLASVLQEGGGTDLSVSLHKLRLTSGEDEERVVEWVKTDGSDHYGEDVLFLGFPGSFAVWTECFGGREVSGGTAYFVIDNTAPKPCSVYRYNFHDGGAATLVETLPPGWHDARCMWFIPAPQITMFPEPDEEQETPAATCSTTQSSQQLTIYASDLSPKVDSSQLRDMFGRHGKVARARVAYDKRGRSRGFGFVTMATHEGFDSAMAAFNDVEPHGSSVISPFCLFVMFLVLSTFFTLFYQFI
ncbi:unnamed protein product [Triticum aestivum]|uniref:RRM domain-containing protein n=1 Tax=Triticum aestivum TaxID=4565 RepID=A0A7H4LNH1_WHEAT|nr:unnamed protein product [Triticum aestivum]